MNRDSCGEDSAAGLAAGATAAPAFEISKQVELGVQVDIGVTPSPRCSRSSTTDSTGTEVLGSPHFSPQDNVGWGATGFAVYFWR